jgi:hypothetical protein
VNPPLAPDLAATLDLIAEAAADFGAPWWIIGSAAARLSGAAIDNIADVDLLLAPADARRFIARFPPDRLAPKEPSAQFRSAVFARIVAAPLPIEAMAGFEMKIAGVWRRIAPESRVWRGRWATPAVDEQIALLGAMGREKDAPRLAALRALL